MKWPWPLVWALDVANRKGKSLGIRLVRLTGKSPYRLHPKHLVETPGQDWYLAHLTPGDRVLDLGCGYGAHTRTAAMDGGSAIGLDADPRQIEIARALTRTAGVWTVSFGVHDLTRPLPFHAGLFDAVLCLDVIEHLTERQALLREIARVLTPGGRLCISGPNRGTRWRQRLRDAGVFSFQDPDHKVEYTREEFRAEINAAGFVLEGFLEPIVYDTPWAGWIDALGGLSLSLYARLARWKRQRALEEPSESTGFRAVARTPG